MIEYLHDIIRASYGDEINIAAIIKDARGAYITDPCYMMLYDNDNILINIGGVFSDNVWNFTIPSAITSGLKRSHRYYYCVCDKDHNDLCFKQPIYFI